MLQMSVFCRCQKIKHLYLWGIINVDLYVIKGIIISRMD